MTIGCPPCARQRAEKVADAQLADFWRLMKPEKTLFQKQEPRWITFQLITIRRYALDAIENLKLTLEDTRTEHTYEKPHCHQTP